MRILIYIMIIAFSASSLSAQGFLERVQKKAAERAARKAEERVDRKIDEKIDKGLDNIENSIDSPESKSSQQKSGNDEQDSQAMMKMLSKMTGGESDYKLQDTYDFSGNFLMEMEIFEKEKSSMKTKMRMFLTKDSEYIGMEVDTDAMTEGQMQGAYILFDTPNKSMITFTKTAETGGMALVMSLPDMEDLEEFSDSDDLEDYSSENTKIRKTGKTKTILGYSCDNYIIEDDETITDAWVTTSLPFNQYQAFNYMQASNPKAQSGGLAGIPNGFLMEAESTHKKDKMKSVIKMLEVNPNKRTSFSTKGYNVMNMGGFMNQGNE